jgi:hypothetical protein
MELTEWSEKSVHKIQTPGNQSKVRIKHSKHGESLKQGKKKYIVILPFAAFFSTSMGTPVSTTPVVTTVSTHSLPAGT